MLAVVEIAGSQFSVSPNSIIDVPHMDGNAGDALEFSNIMFFENDGVTTFGTPYITGKVDAKILEHFRGNKLIVFKKKRRKGYRKLNGHKQSYTKLEITNINI